MRNIRIYIHDKDEFVSAIYENEYSERFGEHVWYA
jgi:hypothetical protein